MSNGFLIYKNILLEEDRKEFLEKSSPMAFSCCTINFICQRIKEYRCFVSTDNAEIASICRVYGAEVIARPEYLAEDATSTDPVIQHALEYFKNKFGYLPQYSTLIQCTYPFLDSEQIDSVFNSLEEPHDCAFACSPFHSFVWEFDKDSSANIANRSLHFQNRKKTRPS